MTLVEPKGEYQNPSGSGWWTATRTATAAGSHPGLEPLTHDDLQAEFVKTAGLVTPTESTDSESVSARIR
jgi:myosin-crossreactive antigen